ncbi:MAG: hypothetical protein ACXW4O_02400, partial [Candidatus Binatia bacterium]
MAGLSGVEFGFVTTLRMATTQGSLYRINQPGISRSGYEPPSRPKGMFNPLWKPQQFCARSKLRGIFDSILVCDVAFYFSAQLLQGGGKLHRIARGITNCFDG